jgi:RHS repeat-associated protein
VDGTSGDTLRNYVYGSDYAPLAQSTAAGAPDFFHADHLGTTRALTTSTGSASLVQQYEPYGTPSNGALSSLTSKYFTAQDRDVYTNLQYHRARWLDTDQGRWYSQDPVFDFPGNFGNGYGYVGGELISSIDLFGFRGLIMTVVAYAILAFMATMILAPLVGLLGGALSAMDAWMGGQDTRIAFKDGQQEAIEFWLATGWMFFTPLAPIAGAFFGGYGFGSALLGASDSYYHGRQGQGNFRIMLGVFSLVSPFEIVKPPKVKPTTIDIDFYHGTTDIFEGNMKKNGINLSKQREFTDFGQGFYVTTNKVHAEQMAQRVVDRLHSEGITGVQPKVVKFSVPYEEFHGLNIVDFEAVTPEWQLFVYRNRNQRPLHTNDITAGPAARSYTKKPSKVKAMDFPEYNQTVFHTEKSVQILNRNLKKD